MRKYLKILLAVVFFILFTATGCEKDKTGIEIPVEPDTFIEISGFKIFHILQTNVRSRVTISPVEDYEVLESGVCWSELKNPTIYDHMTLYEAGAGTFATIITGLSANTTYYARAYAISSRDTIYGEEKSFTTLFEEDLKGTFTDNRDGKEYSWVKIGNQIWMAENLAYLPFVSPPNEGSVSNPYYYVFDYYGTDVYKAKDTYYYALYGVYYNWEATIQGATSSDKNPSGVRGVCPVGWHLPSNAEWEELINYIKDDGHSNEEGTVLKTINGWVSESGNGTDEYGFSALPNGGRAEEMGGKFGSTGINAHWWSSTDDSTPNGWMWDITIDMTSHSIINGYKTNKSFAFSVRCIKD